MASNRSVRYVDLGYSTARQWWDEIGLPAHQRFVAAGNRQTAVDACLHAWHVHDWLWHELNPGSETRGNPAYGQFQRHLIAQCPELAWVRDFADAAKHRGLGRPGDVTGVHDKKVGRPLGSGGKILMSGGRPLVTGARPVSLELIDGTILPLAGVLQTVVDFWNGQLPPNQSAGESEAGPEAC